MGFKSYATRHNQLHIRASCCRLSVWRRFFPCARTFRKAPSGPLVRNAGIENLCRCHYRSLGPAIGWNDIQLQPPFDNRKPRTAPRPSVMTCSINSSTRLTRGLAGEVTGIDAKLDRSRKLPVTALEAPIGSTCCVILPRTPAVQTGKPSRRGT